MQKVRLGYFLYSTKATKHDQIPLYVKIRINGSVVSISTGCNIPFELWDRHTKRLKGNSSIAVQANNRLKLIEDEVYSHAFALERSGKILTAQILKDHVLGKNKKPTVRDSMLDYTSMIRSLIGNKYSSKTLEKYKQTQVRIIEFMENELKIQDLNLISLNDSFLFDFEHFLRRVHNNNQNTCAKHFQRFTTMIRYSLQRGLIEKFPFAEYKIRPVQKEVTFLNNDEIDILRNTDLGEALNKVRDCFMFAIFTGLAYRELANLHSDHIVDGYDGEQWLKYSRQKTKKEVSIPLLPQAKEILERYNSNGFKGKLLPIISNAKFNKHLKKIGDICSIQTPLTVHIARRTFATTILMLNNVPLEIISQCLGHSEISITQKSYARVIPSMLKNHFDRLKGVS